MLWIAEASNIWTTEAKSREIWQASNKETVQAANGSKNIGIGVSKNGWKRNKPSWAYGHHTEISHVWKTYSFG